MTKSRTDLSGRNVAFSIAGRIVAMITSFIGRGIFVRTLNSEYLGLGGFFGNIFSVVSLCELGIGAAIAQSLYKPLAKKDEDKISAIMHFYGKVNGIVAIVTLLLSLCAMPMLEGLSKSSIDIRQLQTAYVLFSLHTALSYILAPKKTLVVCDQRLYVVSALNLPVNIIALIGHSAVLVLTENYIAYLITRIFVITVRDIILNRYADKAYPFLGKKRTPEKGYYTMLASNVRALLWHKVGGTLCRSTDSLLLSMYIGLSGMGKYSNYALVIGTVGAFFDVAINAVGASVGNLGAGDRGEKSESVMRKLYFMNFFLLTVGLCVLVSTVNPFIMLWLGENMLFTTAEMAVIAACFYFSCIRDPVQIFLNTFGIFRQTRFIPMVRAGVNFVLSVIFVKNMGIFGVFLGTLLSTVTVPLYFEVKMLYKYGFGNRDSRAFLKEMCSYILTSFVTSFLCFAITSFIPCTAAGVVLKGVISFGVSVCVLSLMYCNSRYFEFFVHTFLRFVTRRKKENATSV